MKDIKEETPATEEATEVTEEITKQATEKKAKKKTTEAAVKEKKDPPLIYCGPNLPGLSRYTVLKNGIPANIESIIKECPAVKSLIVPTGDLSAVIKAVEQVGTAYELWFKEVMSYRIKLRGGGADGV